LSEKSLLQGHHLYKCYLKNPKKYSFNYCSCCQRQKQLRLKISTSTYLLRASSAALSFGLKNKTELKNVTDRLNR
jgi:hypothetical protein